MVSFGSFSFKDIFRGSTSSHKARDTRHHSSLTRVEHFRAHSCTRNRIRSLLMDQRGKKNNEKIRATKRKKKLNERDREYNGALLCSGLSAVKQCRLPDSVNNPCSEHGDATLDKTVETPRRLALQRSRIPSRIFSFQSDGKKKGRTVVRSPREEEE